MKPINSALFVEALSLALKRLKEEHGDMANYEANFRHNKGRYKYWQLYHCDVLGTSYYWSPCLNKAYPNISTVKQQITRLGY